MSDFQPPTPPSVTTEDLVKHGRSQFKFVLDIAKEAARRGQDMFSAVPSLDGFLGSLFEMAREAHRAIEFRVDPYMTAEEFPTLVNQEVTAYLLVDKDGNGISGFSSGNSPERPGPEEMTRFNELCKRIFVEEWGVSADSIEDVTGLNGKDPVDTYLGMALEQQVDHEVEKFRADMDRTLDDLFGGG